MEVIDNLTSIFTTNLEMVNNNKILSSVIGLFLILYAALAAPKLPKSVTQWFDNMWFKLGFMFLIAYMATKDPSVAIISAVALLVTLQTLSAQKTTENVIQAVHAKVESFGDIVKLKEKLIMAESGGNVITETRSEVYTPHAEVYTPHAEVYTPYAEVQPSRSEVQPSRSEVQPSRSEVQPSHAEVQPSHAEVYTPHAEVRSSHAEVYTPHAEVQSSRSEVYTPHAEVRSSRSEVYTPHAEVQPSRSEVYTPHAEVQPSRSEVYTPHAEVQPSRSEVYTPHAEAEYSQNRQEDHVSQEQVSNILSNCNTVLNNMSGYESGELATF